MNHEPSAPKRNNTIRFVLAGGLGLVLVYAIYDGFLRPADKVVREQVVDTEPVSEVHEQSPNEATEAVPYWRLPLGSLQAAMQYSPFSLDGVHASPDAEQIEVSTEMQYDIEGDNLDSVEEHAMSDTMNSNVEIILETSRGRVAKVGNHILREGSELGPGVVVNRIENSKIVLEVERSEDDDEDIDD